MTAPSLELDRVSKWYRQVSALIEVTLSVGPGVTGLVGRHGDIVVTPERKIISSSLIDYSFNNLGEIKEGQIVQEDLRTITVKVVPWDDLSETTRFRLIKEIESYLQSPKMKVSVQVVDHIRPTPAGKRPILVSRLRLEDVL